MVLVGKIRIELDKFQSERKTILYLLDIRSICCISLSHRKSRKHAKIWNSFYDRPRARQRIDSSELCTCTARTPLHRTTTYCTTGTSCPEWATFCSIYPEFIARLSAKCRRSLSHHRNRSITFDKRRVKIGSNNERGLSIHRTLLEIQLLIFSLIAPITNKTLFGNVRKRRIFWNVQILKGLKQILTLPTRSNDELRYKLRSAD